MGKKAIKVVVCILTAAVLIFGGYGIYFLLDTDGDMEKVCIESSSKNATEFDYMSDSKDPHRYYTLSLNGDGEYQELFIFDEQPFLFIKHTGRYHLTLKTDPEKVTSVAVGSLLVPPRDGSERGRLIFFSDNSARIAKCTYTLLENGEKSEETRKIPPAQDFIIFIDDIGTDASGNTRTVGKADFFDENGELVYTSYVSSDS